MVVLLHTYWSHDLYSLNLIRNGYLFVDLFFILSGFVIIYNYYDKIICNTVSAYDFMKKRFFRLWPLHFLLLIIFLFLEFVKLVASQEFNVIGSNIPFTENNHISFIANLLLIQSFNLFNDSTFNGPSWSIGVEFYTYLCFFISLTFFKTKRWLFKYFSLIVVVICFCFLFFKVGHLSVTHDFGFIRCLLGFFSGILLFFIFKSLSNRDDNTSHKRKSVFFWTFLELILIVFLIYFFENKSEIDRLDFIAYFINFLLIFLFLFSNGIVSKIICTKFFVFLGKISYSIYMIHYFFSLLFKNFLKFYFKAPFINDHWGGYLEIDSYIGNVTLFIYLIVVIIISSYTYKYIEIRYKNGFNINK